MAKKVSVGVQIDGSAKGFKKASEEAAQATQKLRKKVDRESQGMGAGFKKLMGIIGATFAINKLLQFGRELVTIASKAEGVRAAFARLNDPALLSNLRKATRGTVDDITLMTQAIQATNRGVDIKLLATAFEFATARAIDTGEAVEYLVGEIVNGLGTGSVKVLDNLGLSQQELQKRTKTLGSTTAAAASMMKEAMAAAGKISDTTATRIARVNTQWANMKTRIGEAIVQSGLFEKAMISLEAIATKALGIIDPKAAMALEDTETLQKILNRSKEEQLILEEDVLKQKQAYLDLDREDFNSKRKYLKALDDQTDKLNDAKKLLQDQVDLQEMISSILVVRNNDAKGVRQKFTGSTIGGLGITDLNKKQPKKPWTGPDISNLRHMTPTILPFVEEVEAVGLEWINDLDSAFLQFFSNTEGGFKSMSESFGRALQSMAAQLAAKAAIFGILTALTGGANIAMAQAAKGALTNFKWFADGGIVSGPTMGMVGEYPGAKSNPEVVAPLSKLKGMLGEAGGGNIIATGLVSGRDLKLILRRN